VCFLGCVFCDVSVEILGSAELLVLRFCLRQRCLVEKIAFKFVLNFFSRQKKKHATTKHNKKITRNDNPSRAQEKECIVVERACDEKATGKKNSEDARHEVAVMKTELQKKK
jgi:hypothetical protein